MATKSKRQALSAVFVQSVKEPGTYSDGAGLTLRVEKSGAKQWAQRVTIDGKSRNLGLGGYPTVSLAEACKAALWNVRMIQEGRDPLAEKRAKQVRIRVVSRWQSSRNVRFAIIPTSGRLRWEVGPPALGL